MKKRLFAMFLVLVMMTVAVAACGKSGNKESSKNKNGEETETVLFEGRDVFTSDISVFLKKLKGIKLYGGGNDGKESVHKAIGSSLRKFPVTGRNKAVLVFTDAYGSNDYEEYIQYPVCLLYTSPSPRD